MCESSRTNYGIFQKGRLNINAKFPMFVEGAEIVPRLTALSYLSHSGFEPATIGRRPQQIRSELHRYEHLLIVHRRILVPPSIRHHFRQKPVVKLNRNNQFTTYLPLLTFCSDPSMPTVNRMAFVCETLLLLLLRESRST